MPRRTIPLPPPPPLDTAQRAETFQKVAQVANRPGKGAPKRPKGVVGAMQTLFAKPNLARQTENVYRRDVAWRPIISAADQLPEGSGQGGLVFVARKAKR
ncbi:MAG TPA: hypothetical protein VEA44_05190 [Caulobacter sp.]|nr:hypothetical protein [Caulobacter sp.]